MPTTSSEQDKAGLPGCPLTANSLDKQLAAVPYLELAAGPAVAAEMPGAQPTPFAVMLTADYSPRTGPAHAGRGVL